MYKNIYLKFLKIMPLSYDHTYLSALTLYKSIWKKVAPYTLKSDFKSMNEVKHLGRKAKGPCFYSISASPSKYQPFEVRFY